MIRRIIKINKELCNGCGICADACHEGAIGIVDGKAALMRENYCDGLGDCLPACPTGAITFEEREAPAYDEAAVKAAQAAQTAQAAKPAVGVESQICQWPVQIKLVPVEAPYFDNANLLVAADCTAFAYGNFHNEFMKKRITVIGCPKLDMVDYTSKLTEILSRNEIQSLTVVRMEVPCCGGIEMAAKQAMKNSGKRIPWQVVTISVDGRGTRPASGRE